LVSPVVILIDAYLTRGDWGKLFNSSSNQNLPLDLNLTQDTMSEGVVTLTCPDCGPCDFGLADQDANTVYQL